jgi:transcriptional regulator with XRE-family HTH domain
MFCDKLKEVRNLHNITQAKLASAIGMSRQAVIKYEQGERFPDEDTLVKLADFFNVSLDYLLGRNISYAENIAVTISTELNKRGLLNDIDIDNKLDSIINLTEALIKEFVKYERK